MKTEITEATPTTETGKRLCRLLRKAEILQITDFANSTLYDMIRRGAFPPPVKLSDRFVAWREDDYLVWLNSRPKTLGPKASGAALTKEVVA